MSSLAVQLKFNLNKMASKQGYGPDLRKYVDKRLNIRLNGRRKISGNMIGFDHFMNIVLDNAVEHKGKETKDLGKVMLRGNNIIMWECVEKI